ncbi:hypothetical protein, partial [Mycobacterium interjectum]|uniref:hypothetical protein n=1 Tax=Mycobacterium interjectum TaxID=33895 RepID=UPI0021F2BB3E
MSTDLDNAPTLRTRSIGAPSTVSEPRIAHRGCYATGSRALAATDTTTLTRLQVVSGAVVPLPTASVERAPRKCQGLYALKPWYTRRLTPIVNVAVARRISPDVFTAAGVAAAGAAGVTVALGWWPLAAPFLALRLAGANLDGAVARARGVSRPWGFGRQRDRRPRLGPADLHGAGDVGGATARPRAALVVLAGADGAGGGARRDAAHLRFAGRGGGRRAARNGGPLGKTERCLFVLLATAFPVILPVVATQLVNGSQGSPRRCGCGPPVASWRPGNAARCRRHERDPNQQRAAAPAVAGGVRRFGRADRRGAL